MTEQIRFYEAKLTYQIDPADLFEQLENNVQIAIIDARRKFGYEIEHIPGAINLPHRQMNLESTAHLDKSLTYICYCDGIGCNGSTRGALKMAKLGFKVKELIGGLEWWKRDGFATQGSEATAGAMLACAC